MSEPSKNWLTRAEAAEMLGVSVDTLELYASRGIGPRYSRAFPKRALYRRDWIDEWLEAHAVTKSSAA